MSTLTTRFYYKWKSAPLDYQLFQRDATDCYVVACLNALRCHYPTFRKKSLKEVLAIRNEVLEMTGNSRSIYKALDALKELGYIKSYHKEKSRLVYFMKKLGCAVISQKRVRGLPKSPVKRQNAVLQRVKDGLGFPNHASAVRRFSRVFGVQCINSMERVPQYAIKDLDQIQAIYKIIPNE